MVERADAVLLSTVRDLYPGAEVDLVRRRRRDPTAAAEYVVLPHRRAPRLLVPAGPASATARAVRRFSAAASYSDTARRLAVSALARSHGAGAFPDRVVVQGSRAGSLAAHLDEVFGVSVSFSLGLGTERVNRKPVLQIFGPTGRTLAFAKLGDSPQARTDVAAEAAALGQLAGRQWRLLELPSVLHYGTWGAMSLLLLSPLATSPLQAPRGEFQAPVAAMTELENAFGAAPVPVAELDWILRQRTGAAALADRHARETMLDCIDRLCTAAGDLEWRPGAWHGDWTPWNMARAGRRVLVWDWERFETGVPVGLDRCHYTVNAITRRQGTSTITIRAGLGAAGADPSAPGSHSHTLGGLYLLAVAGRYLTLAEGPRGGDIAPRGTAMLDTLNGWLRS